MKFRLRFAGIHLAVSLVVALALAALIFGLWYPYPYSKLSGGAHLFLLLIAVDVILGPLITFVVFNPKKIVQELRRDILCIVILQILALSYGLWTVYVARPVHLVFEYDRFRVVHAIEVDPELLSKAPPQLSALPFQGPTLLGLRSFNNPKEESDATLAALAGISLASRPDLWQPYQKSIPEVLLAAKPVSSYKNTHPEDSKLIQKALLKIKRTPENTVYLPLIDRTAFWTALLDPATAEILEIIPVDSFEN